MERQHQNSENKRQKARDMPRLPTPIEKSKEATQMTPKITGYKHCWIPQFPALQENRQPMQAIYGQTDSQPKMTRLRRWEWQHLQWWQEQENKEQAPKTGKQSKYTPKRCLEENKLENGGTRVTWKQLLDKIKQNAKKNKW